MKDQPSKQQVKVVALPGDGIGPEVMEQGLAILELAAAGAGLEVVLDVIPCGGAFYLTHGTRDWPEGSEESCASADLILLGAVGHPDASTGAPVTMRDGRMAGWSPVIGNRARLDLFANVRPVRLLPGVSHRISGRRGLIWKPDDVDMVFVRENTEDLYCGIGGRLEGRGISKLASDTRIITREASERVIRFAFELSRERGAGAALEGERRVTCVLKDNVLEGCRLFGEVFREVAADFPEVENELAIVDAFAARLITEPERYDVCVTTNMFGDILTDLAAVLQGGMGLAVGCNIGPDHAMFEPVHGSAPDLAGKDTANPMAMILAVGSGLGWLAVRRDLPALERAAEAIERSVEAVLKRGAPLTRDLAGAGEGAALSEVGGAVADELRALLRDC